MKNLKNNPYYTTLDEARRLIELGIDVTTADMSYHIYPLSDLTYEVLQISLTKDEINEENVPCWSMGRMFDLIPGNARLGRDNDGECECQYESEENTQKNAEFDGEPTELLYNMIVYLLHNNIPLRKLEYDD